MTPPMTPREKVAALKTNDPTNPAHRLASDLQAGHFAPGESRDDLIEVLSNLPRYAALASGSGDHADHSGEATNMVDHAELCERLRDTYIRFNMGHREAPLRNPDGPLAAEALDALLAENAALRAACSKSNDEISQTLGKALGYPWFKDDQINFPGATAENGVCVGDHVAESLADEAARRITDAERKLAEADGLLREWMGTWFVDADSRGENAIADDTRKWLSKEAERG